MQTNKLLNKIENNKELKRLAKAIDQVKEELIRSNKEQRSPWIGDNHPVGFAHIQDRAYLKAKERYYQQAIPLLVQIETEKASNKSKINKLYKRYKEEVKEPNENLKMLEDKVRQILTKSNDMGTYYYYKEMSAAGSYSDKTSDQIAKDALQSLITKDELDN